MVSETDTRVIAEYCKSNLNLENASLGNEYHYHSLPLCIIDAVFSIGVRYSSTENTVRRFCEYFGQKIFSLEHPPIEEQLSVSKFIRLLDGYSIEDMAVKIYGNKQRTSARNGILKAKAVLMFAEVLYKFGVDYYQDMYKVLGSKDFETTIAEIPGHRSGISTRYFYMLAGSDDYIKPDRMITRFIWSAIQQNLSVEESHNAIIGAHKTLVKEYPQLTPKILDHQIWLYQREKPTPK